MSYQTKEPKSCLQIIFTLAFITFFFSCLFYWQAGLWFSGFTLKYWTQALPLALLLSPLFWRIADDSKPAPAIQFFRLVIGVVNMGSFFAQAAVWVGILKSPIF